MTELRIGKIVARGSDAFCALVKLALDECVNQRIENLPARDFFIEEHTPVEFRNEGYVIKATGDTAEGYVHSSSVLWVNARIARDKPGRARHIVRHEIAHEIPLTVAKQTQLMALMLRADGQHPVKWDKGGYLSRPYECFADTFAEAVSGKDSPWDDYAFYRLDVLDADVPQFVSIVTAPDPGPVPPPPPPEPTPPVDPAIEQLKADNAALKVKIGNAQAALA